MADEPTTRKCVRCHTVKPLAQFSRAANGVAGHKNQCKACDAAKHKATSVPRPTQSESEKRQRYTRNWQQPKTCTRCGETKPRDDFSVMGQRKYGPALRAVCKTCFPASKRHYDLKWMYGLTVAEYEAMLAAQGGVCAVCKQPERMRRAGKLLRMPVDHDHRTGEVRGILCHRCNRALGLLTDSPTTIRKVIRYLHDRD